MAGLDPVFFRREVNPDTKSIVYWARPDRDVIYFGKDDLSIFERECRTNRANGRVCLHYDSSAPYHDMIIFEWSIRDFPTHRHPGKSETIMPLLGEVTVVINDGSNKNTYCIVPGQILLVPPNTWHKISTGSPYSIYRESKMGPFLGDSDREFLIRKEK